MSVPDLILRTRLDVLRRNLEEVAKVIDTVEDHREMLRHVVAVPRDPKLMAAVATIDKHVIDARGGLALRNDATVEQSLTGIAAAVADVRSVLERARRDAANIETRWLEPTSGELHKTLSDLLVASAGNQVKALDRIRTEKLDPRARLERRRRGPRARGRRLARVPRRGAQGRREVFHEYVDMLGSADVLTAMGAIHEHRGELDAALACFERAHALEPANVGLIVDAARLRRNVHGAASALELVGPAVDGASDLPERRWMRGTLLRETGTWARRAPTWSTPWPARRTTSSCSSRWLRPCATSSSGGPRCRRSSGPAGSTRRPRTRLPGKGTVLLFLGELNEAAAVLQHAVALDPWHAPAQLQLARTLSSLNRPDEALVAANHVLDVDPGSAPALTVKARLVMRREGAAAARPYFDAAIEAAPNEPGARAEYGECLRQLGEHDAALRHLDRAVAGAPESAYAAGTRGAVLRALERFEEAEAELRRAITLDPALEWLYSSLAEALIAGQRLGDAIEVVQECGRAIPHSSATRVLLGALLSAQDRNDEALVAVEEALALAPEDRWAQQNRVDVLVALGQAEDALEYAEATRGARWHPRRWSAPTRHATHSAT